MKKALIIIVILAVVGIGIYYFSSNNSSNQAPGTTSPEPTPPAANNPASSVPLDVTISLKNFLFVPSTVTIAKGAKVTWVNNDTVAHTITSDTGTLLHSPTLAPGQSFSFTFVNPGIIDYHCSIHPVMKGQIIIQN